MYCTKSTKYIAIKTTTYLSFLAKYNPYSIKNLLVVATKSYQVESHLLHDDLIYVQT